MHDDVTSATNTSATTLTVDNQGTGQAQQVPR
jgi:hypothetical protein